MKTAGQELLERLTNLSNITYFNGKKSDCDIIEKISNMVRNDLIPKEKQQIIEACIKTTQDCWISNAEAFGLDLVFTEEDLKNQIEEAEQYYNETFS